MELSPIAALNPRFEAEHGLLVLELEHGKANEVGSVQLDAFAALPELIESTPEIRSLCTTSSRVSSRGKAVFIAGANVTEREGWDRARVKAHVRRQRDIMVALRRLPIYSMVLTHGVTLGWGAEYLLTADYSLATATASFALPETGLGILPGARGTAELAQVVGPAQAMRLGCTGESIDAAEALRIGLIQELMTGEPSAQLDAGMRRVREIASLVQQRSPTALAAFKLGVLDSMGRENEQRLATEARAYELCVDTGEAAKGRENFAAIRSGRAPAWGPRVTHRTKESA